MAPSFSKRPQLWHADWFVGVLVVLAVLFLHGVTDFSGTRARRHHDFASTNALRQPVDRTAIIAMDDQRIAQWGGDAPARSVPAEVVAVLKNAAVPQFDTPVAQSLLATPEEASALRAYDASQTMTAGAGAGI